MGIHIYPTLNTSTLVFNPSSHISISFHPFSAHSRLGHTSSHHFKPLSIVFHPFPPSITLPTFTSINLHLTWSTPPCHSCTPCDERSLKTCESDVSCTMLPLQGLGLLSACSMPLKYQLADKICRGVATNPSNKFKGFRTLLPFSDPLDLLMLDCRYHKMATAV